MQSQALRQGRRQWARAYQHLHTHTQRRIVSTRLCMSVSNIIKIGSECVQIWKIKDFWKGASAALNMICYGALSEQPDILWPCLYHTVVHEGVSWILTVELIFNDEVVVYVICLQPFAYLRNHQIQRKWRKQREQGRPHDRRKGEHLIRLEMRDGA